MEQEHPIPQQISAYQFRLVGDMTLKQFFQVAGGALISLLLYASSLPVYVKWPLIIISFLLGVAFAFFPLQDRPLATWLVLFFKAIYSPTVYVWKRGAGTRQFFKPEPTAGEPPAEEKGKEEKEAESALSSVNVEEFRELEKKERELLKKIEAQLATTEIPAQFEKAKDKKVEVEIPKDKKVEVEHEEKKQPRYQQTPSPDSTGIEVKPSAAGGMSDSKKAKFSKEAAPPTPPTRPNVVVGQVMDPEGKIVEGAILEIKDDDGRSVRALKTNKAGHFMIVTPLSDGKYQIITEKQGFEFDPLSFTANGKIIPPIAIRATETSEKIVEKEK